MTAPHAPSAGPAAAAFAAWMGNAPSPTGFGALHTLARFATLGRQAEGAAAVQIELATLRDAAAASGLLWALRISPEGRTLLEATAPPGSVQRSLLLTLSESEGLLTQVQLQRGPAAQAGQGALVLPPALRTLVNGALAARTPMLMAHVGPEGQPLLSFRGSLQVLDGERLCMWIRNAQGAFLQAIQAQPRVAFMYRNEDTKATYQFQGRAHCAQESALRQAVYDAAPQVERDHDFAMAGVAVVVTLDRVEGYAGLGPAGQIDRILLVREPVLAAPTT